MDPDANLAMQRRIVARMVAREEYPDEMSKAELQRYHADVAALADLVEALDGWLTRGGALPRAWQGQR